METHWLIRLSTRLRPRYGWLPFLLLAGALAGLLFSVRQVDWVRDDGFIIPVLTTGFISAFILAQSKIRPWAAGAILIVMGMALALVLVADLRPDGALLARGPAAVAEFVRLRAGLFLGRVAGWFRAVMNGGRSSETAAFALGLALAGWLVAAFLPWSAYRMRRPFLGLTLVGLALAANTFYGQAGLYWVALFFGAAITGGIYLTHLFREEAWEARGIDYPADVRTDLLFYTAGLSLGVMSLAAVLPAVNLRAIAEPFQNWRVVTAAEEMLDRAFGGVAISGRPAGGSEGLPRSFLLGGSPDLAATIVMTATYRAEPAADLARFHWRYTSYDEYTGDGWRRSPERNEAFAGGQPITPPMAPPVAGALVQIAQQVDWLQDQRITRYTLGRPAVFSHDVMTAWRGQDDFVGALGQNDPPVRYAAESTVVVATPDELRAARLEDVPSTIRTRYTGLPDSIPRRVLDLARRIAAPEGSSLSPYDQARAIEAFLHQYPYTLDLPPPPADVDIVDYFLFDAQTGFCDYYASAMVVMARAVGLPARLGVGFMQRPPDAAGVQTIRLLDAHSWAEVYFAGVGWVEFEPTAPFAVVGAAVAPGVTGDAPAAPTPPSPSPAIPQRAPRREFPWAMVLAVAALVLVALRLRGGRIPALFAPRYADLDEVESAYARLQAGAARLGVVVEPSQTPAEFAEAMAAASAFDMSEVRPLRQAITRLAALFAARRYSAMDDGASDEAAEAEARRIWSELDAPLRRLIRRRR